MKKFLTALWGVFRNNLLLKIMAVLFALILWSYILSDTNPLRERRVSNVTVRYEHTEELKAKDLAISESLSDVLNKVDVRVEVKQNELRYLSAENVEAYIDLSTVNGTGEHVLKVSAQTTYGEVLEVSPSKVTVYVDDYVTRAVPVAVDIVGSVPSGYHADAPEISPGVISVSGARVDVETVASGVCQIDLSGLKEGYNKSIKVNLLGIGGETVDETLFAGDLPSVIVDLVIRPMKSVAVDATGSILGMDSLAPGYEIADIVAEPDRVDIVGEQSVLDGISVLPLVAYSISGAGEDIVVLLDYELPEGVELLTTEKAQVFISIREITDIVQYGDVEIMIKNIPDDMEATIDISVIEVTVIAGLSQLSQLQRSDIVPFIDMEGFEVGTYTLNIQYQIPEGYDVKSFSSGVDTVTVTIKRK